MHVPGGKEVASHRVSFTLHRGNNPNLAEIAMRSFHHNVMMAERKGTEKFVEHKFTAMCGYELSGK